MPQQDWFAANAPKAKEPSGDWFAANEAQSKAQPTPQKPSGGVGTFVKSAAERLNPVAMAQGFGRMVIPETAARAMGAGDAEAEQYGPINTLRNMGQGTQEVFEQAKRAYDSGDYGSAAIKAFFGMIPVLGPDVNQMGDKMRAGQHAEALGEATGLGASLVAPQAVKAVAPVVDAAKARIATAADTGAATRTADVMVPKIGPNKRKFGNMAAQVAPTVARETTAVTRGGMLEQGLTRLDDLNAALDAGYDAVPKTQRYATKPIRDGIELEIKNLSVAGSGGAVEPATRAARIASLKQALKEVDALGSVTDINNLRKLKASWGEGGKKAFTPDIVADAFNERGAGHGWADANGVVDRYMASKHPELKALSTDVSLWIKATDVMQAAEEIERVRPTVGRSIMARGLGAATGAAGAGVPGAVVGAVVGPLVERWISNAHPAAKMIVARQMASLADALRAGNPAKATSIITNLNKLVPAGAAVQGASGASAGLPRAAEHDPQTLPAAGRRP